MILKQNVVESCGVLSIEDLSSRRMEGITSYTEVDFRGGRKHVTIGISPDIKEQVFSCALHFMYGGLSIQICLLCFFSG